MLAHLKTWNHQEKEASRRAFEEGSRQRAAMMQNQRRFTVEEILARLNQTQAAASAGLMSVNG